jgi:hypothetical protein
MRTTLRYLIGMPGNWRSHGTPQAQDHLPTSRSRDGYNPTIAGKQEYGRAKLNPGLMLESVHLPQYLLDVRHIRGRLPNADDDQPGDENQDPNELDDIWQVTYLAVV